MSTLDWPSSVVPQSGSGFWLRANTQESPRSPLTGAGQTMELDGAVWRATLVFQTMDDALWAQLAPLTARLRGRAGRIYIGPFNRRTQKGAIGAATPAVKGGSQTGATLETDGWEPGVAGVLLAGDYVAFEAPRGRELHMVVEAADSDSNGEATLTIEPPIRAAPNDNEPLILTDPTCIMQLVDDEQGQWLFRRGPLSAGTLELIEAIF